MHAVVITGIAQGMGREVAKILARSHVPVAGFDLDAQGIASLDAELRQLGDRHLLQVLDITDRAAVLKFRDAVLHTFPAVDAVLSNAGVGSFGPLEELDLDRARKCLEINVLGTAAIFQAFIPHLRERRAGKLIAMSSMVGVIPFPFESMYSASKFAIEGLVQSMRYEVAPFGIQVALVRPAQVSTTFGTSIHQHPPETSPYHERVERFIARDLELIKTAPTPAQAAERIAAVVMAPRLKLANHLDAAGTFLATLVGLLPYSIRDAILVRHLGIG